MARARKSMPADVKARLRATQKERNAARRKAHPLLKDLTPADLLVACDWAEEHDYITAGVNVRKVDHCRLKGITFEQEAALCSRLPHATRYYSPHPQAPDQTLRECAVWERKAIRAILEFLGVEEYDRKYLRWWRGER